ncbi:MAG: hypothetical protein KDA89_22010, partial [Planctomycetaceae bacterium]|nr:hypothetical protein [Planctomycetaceae bacterium]
EPWLDGWTVQLLDSQGLVVQTAVTSGRDMNLDGRIDAETEGGWYQFVVSDDQAYSVRQILPNGWVQTAEISFDTSSPASQQINDLQLRQRVSYYLNAGGLGEKWLYSDTRGWHYITPDGVLYRWTGGGLTPLRGTKVADVGTEYFADPTLLFNGQYSSESDANQSVIARTDFGNAEVGEVRGRAWLDFYSNGQRDTIELVPDVFVLYPADPLPEGSEWFYDYENAVWYIIDADGNPSYFGPNEDDGGDDFNRTNPGNIQARTFIEQETEPWINGRTVELVDRNGNVVATTTTQSIDFNNDGTIQPETERGWYVFEDVPSGDYTVRMPSQSGWMVTAPVSETQATAISVDAAYGLERTLSDFFNWGHENERWVLDRNHRWNYILPDGRLYEWTVGSNSANGGLQGTLRATLSAEYYNDLNLLTDPPAAVVTVSVRSGAVADDVLFGNHRMLDELIGSL